MGGKAKPAPRCRPQPKGERSLITGAGWLCQPTPLGSRAPDRHALLIGPVAAGALADAFSIAAVPLFALSAYAAAAVLAILDAVVNATVTDDD